MDDNKSRLVSSILRFLKDELRGTYFTPEDLEGLEVAIQCLESTYRRLPAALSSEPPLDEIYNTFLAQTLNNRPDPSEDAKKEAEKLKVEGNAAMTAHLYNEALEFYSKAIDLNSKNAVYYCNRAAAFSKLSDHKSAIIDCERAIELDSKYSKAYGRLGLAYTGLDDYVKALENYKMASELDPANEGYRTNASLAEQKIAELQQSGESTSASTDQPSGNGPDDDFSTVLTNPQLLSLATRMLSDPTMQTMMSTIMNRPSDQEGTNRMDALIEAGHQLAQQLQTERPQLVDQLRQTLVNIGVVPTESQPSDFSPDQNDSPDQNKEG